MLNKIKEKITNMSVKSKYILIALICFMLGGIICGNGGVPQDEYDNLQKICSTTEETLHQRDNTIKELNSTIDELKKKVESASPWFAMKVEEQKAIEEENARVAEEKRIAQEKAKEEERVAQEKKAEEERIAKENAEKNKYDTNIAYSDVARNPDKYMLQLGKFSGKVLQVIEGDSHNNLRVAVNSNYDNVLLVEYDPSIVDVRILDNDQITIYGTNMGTVSYTSTLGATITIPAMLADKIVIK